MASTNMAYPLSTEPTKVNFGPEEDKRRLDYVYDNIEAIKRGLREITKDKLPKWRRAYEGKPDNIEKNFPWRGASNIVVQLIAANVGTLKSQVLASIYEVLPIWTSALVGDWGAEANGDEQRSAIEAFMNLMAMEPSELDLYRVESVWVDSAIKYGFSALKAPYVVEKEDICLGIPNADAGPVFKEIVKRYGPKPEVVPFEDFGINPTATSMESCRFKYHVLHLSKYDLLDRKFLKIYDADAVEAVLKQPDGTGPTEVEREKQDSIGARSDSLSPLEQRWDIYECHYPYLVTVGGQERKLYIIETYHLGSKTSLRAVYNWYPENMDIFTGARLGYSDRGIYEMGYCEILEHAQRETTAEHNRYADNGTLANTSVFRIDPDLSTRLDASFSMFPLSMIPAREGEFEVFNIGRQNDTGIQREQQNLSLVQQRLGIDNGMSAPGGGVVNPKRGIYSAMGTFSALQAGNRRSNMIQSDFKNAHINMGRKALLMYAYLGINPEKYKQFGKDEKWLRLAFENIKAGRINIPVRGTTASINREMEKQNDMLMVNIMRQHYMGVAQILQNLPQAPSYMQDYLVNTVIANDYLMRHFLRNFGYDDISRLLPEPKFITQLKEQQQRESEQRQQQSGGGTTPNAAGTSVPQFPVSEGNNGEQGQSLGGVQETGGNDNIPVSQPN